jgi:hypothetical protein
LEAPGSVAKNYPPPIIEHDYARKRALAALGSMRASHTTR